MMKALRHSSSGWPVKILLGLVVVAFVVTGFSSFIIGNTSGAVIKAGKTEVSTQDYLLAYQQVRAELSARLQRPLTREELDALGVEGIVVGRLSSNAVLDEQGRSMGLGLSEDRLARIIADDPAFHDQAGNFSRSVFSGVIERAGMREADFIRNRQGDALRSQVVEAIADGVAAPSVLQTVAGLYSGERRTVEYVTLAPSVVEPIPAPPQEVLATYFEANKDTYRAPEYRAVAYALLTPDALTDRASITDAQVEDDYNRSGDRYATPERRRIEQIVYPDKAAADAAKAALDGGKLFEQLIIESGRTVADTELGLLAKAEIPDPALAEAAFALGVGMSSVVEGAFGPALLRVGEIQAETRRPLADVREEIRRDMALTAASAAVQPAYDAYEDARGSGRTLEEAAELAGVPVKSVPAVTRDGKGPDDQPIADLPADPAFLTAVFASEVDAENLPMSYQSNGYVAYEVRKIDPARDRTLDEVKAEVVADWTAVETERLLTERVKLLQDRLAKGETLDQVAASENLVKTVAPSLTRRSGGAEIGSAASRAAFSGGLGSVVSAPAADGKGKILMIVTEVAPPADPAANVSQDEVRQLDEQLQNDLYQSYVLLLREDYPPVPDRGAIERARTLLR